MFAVDNGAFVKAEFRLCEGTEANIFLYTHLSLPEMAHVTFLQSPKDYISMSVVKKVIVKSHLEVYNKSRRDSTISPKSYRIDALRLCRLLPSTHACISGGPMNYLAHE